MISASDKAQLVKEALTEAQQTVRAYDTKAQIVGVGYIFALGIVFRLGDLLPKVERSDVLLVIGGWSIVIFPILLFGFVLYPTRKSISGTRSDANLSRGLLYFSPGSHNSVDSYIEALGEADGLKERTEELFSVTELRELKRKRFLRALFAAGVAFVMLFWAQIWRGLAGS
jgi:hypothetical protein